MSAHPGSLCVIMAAAGTTAAVAADDESRPNEVPGWGRVMDRGGGLRRFVRSRIQPAEDPSARNAPRSSAEVPQLPMNGAASSAASAGTSRPVSAYSAGSSRGGPRPPATTPITAPA